MVEQFLFFYENAGFAKFPILYLKDWYIGNLDWLRSLVIGVVDAAIKLTNRSKL